MQCHRCWKDLPIESFPKYKSRGKEYRRRQCQTCYSAKVKQRLAKPEVKARIKANRRATDKEVRTRQTRRTRWRSYGVDPDFIEQLLIDHDGKCGLCQEVIVGVVCIDHDHATKKFRDVLCNNCNAGLGQFKDDPKRLALAIQYLAKHSANG